MNTAQRQQPTTREELAEALQSGTGTVGHARHLAGYLINSTDVRLVKVTHKDTDGYREYEVRVLGTVVGHVMRWDDEKHFTGSLLGSFGGGVNRNLPRVISGKTADYEKATRKRAVQSIVQAAVFNTDGTLNPAVVADKRIAAVREEATQTAMNAADAFARDLLALRAEHGEDAAARVMAAFLDTVAGETR